MALKAKITKAQFDDLDEILQAEYKANGDDYELDVTGGEDVSALKAARDNEKTKRHETKAKLDATAKELSDLKDTVKGLESGSDEAATWKQKFHDLETQTATAKAETNKRLAASEKSRLVSDFAGEVAAKPKLFGRMIKDNLAVSVDDSGKFITTVLDDDGNPTDKTLADFKKEVVADKEFADMLKASNASGGAGAGKSKPNMGGGAPKTPKKSDGEKAPDLSKMSNADLAAHMKAKKEAEADDNNDDE